jgi:hypothetical protein
MAKANVNGVRIFYEIAGVGEIPLVLVHGLGHPITAGTASFPDWQSHSEFLHTTAVATVKDGMPSTQGSVREDVPDLAALI